MFIMVRLLKKKKKYFKMGAETQLSVLMVINSKLCIRYKV